MSIGENIKKLRKLNNLTQQQLADELNIGRSTVAGYEKGSIKVTPDKVRLLSKIFDCDVNDLHSPLLFEDDLIGKKVIAKGAPIDPDIPNELQSLYKYFINQFHHSLKDHVRSELPEVLGKTHSYVIEVMTDRYENEKNIDIKYKELLLGQLEIYHQFFISHFKDEINKML